MDLSKLNLDEYYKDNPQALDFAHKYYQAQIEALEYKSMFQEVRELLLSSPKKEKYKWMSNLTQQEIANKIGCSVRTLRTRRSNSLRWKDNITPDPARPRKWRIASHELPSFMKEMSTISKK